MQQLILLLAMQMIATMATPQGKINTYVKNKEDKMSSVEKNKEVIQKIYEEALNKRDLALLQELISEDYEGASGGKGAAAFEVPVVALMKAVPDIHWNIEQLIGEGDLVMVKWNVQGTHTGPFLHFAATGAMISNDGLGIYELKDGKVIKAQVHTDRLGFLQELGVVPKDLTLLSNNLVNEDQVVLIDKFLMPEKAKQEFYQRMDVNRKFIKALPGFVEDAVYKRVDERGNIEIITIAVWENEDALNKARESVQTHYKKEGFNPAEMLERLNITMERSIFKKKL